MRHAGTCIGFIREIVFMRNADNIVINPSAGAIAVAAGSSETNRVTNDYFSGFPERFATDSSARLTLLQRRCTESAKKLQEQKEHHTSHLPGLQNI